jgi:predicted transcriptional regulator
MAQDTETRQTIRLPNPLLDRLRVMAEADHRSVHSLMLSYIERGLAADERTAKRAATMASRAGEAR